jgi:hypothetical protein
VEGDRARGQRPGLDQGEVLRPSQVPDLPGTLPKDQRQDQDFHFVDEVVVEERGKQLGTSGDHQVASRLAAEGHEPGNRIAVDELGPGIR